MFHLDNNSGIDVMPKQKQTISRQQKWFTEGDTQTPPSYPGADWFNIIQAELLNVLKDGDITPSKSELSQLSAAIKNIINKNQIKINDASLITKGVVNLNSAVNSTSETEAATPLAVKKVNDNAIFAHDRISQVHDFSKEVNGRINSIVDRFQPDYYETRMYSHDKRFYIVIRDDGTMGMYSHVKKDVAWFINHDGWLGGYIDCQRVTGLDQFVRDRTPPVGVPMPWPTNKPPAGWLECNGSTFDKNQFPKLAAAYTSGKLPDLRGEFIRGWDNTRGVDANREILKYQSDAIRNITGTFGFEAALGGNTGVPPVSGAFYDIADANRKHISASTAGTNSTVVFDASRVVPTANENRPRNIAFMYIVKAE